ncbi:MAG: T9SS type A sorting domain-containing protein [Bacteroidetes bacterium]|nr:MAG: T9SS type A sorting domain-containing protein [Bacteroidota bacterium]
MKKRSTLYGLFLLLLLSAAATNNAWSQTIWLETFADQASATTQWVSGGTNPGAEVWTWTNDPLAGYVDPAIPAFSAPTASDGYFYFNSDANGENNAHDVTLTGVGNPANCSGKTNVHLRFAYQYIEYNSSAQAWVGISTDGVNFAYEEIFANAGSNQILEGTLDVAVPGADNQAQVWVSFRWAGNWEYHFKVDDVELYEKAGPVPCDQNPMSIICDNIDNYNTTMRIGPQAAWWTTWSGTEGGAEDGIVTTEQANTMPNSMKIVSTATNGGPQDVVLDLGNKSTGRYELKWKIYVPSGKNGYYNIQQTVPIGNGDWNLNVFFNDNNEGEITDGANVSVSTFLFPYDEWFECRHVIDLDNNIAAYYMADTFVIKTGFTRNLGGIDFYGTNNKSTFYIDDVEYVELPAVVYDEDICDSAVDLSLYFGQAPGIPQTTGLYDNTDANTEPSDPTVTCWNEDVSGATDVVNTSMWYTFTGDGATYHIETVPCNATNYIGTAQDDLGDTQMLIYEGDDCSNLTPILCNDDLYSDGNPDWRSGLDIETTKGQNYYMLLDGFEFNGVLATGEFCIEITQVPSITCADGQVGTFTLDNNGIVCFGSNANQIITIDESGFVIPNIGPVYGMAWSLTPTPVDANTWPGTIPGVASTTVNPNIVTVSVPNDGSGLQPGQYYFTMTVVAGGTLINPSAAARVFNVDPSGGCFFNSPSQLVTLLPPLDPLDGVGELTPATQGNSDGAITLTVTGGITSIADPSLLQYNWSGPNGFTATTQNISNIPAGDYLVTITDPTGCVDPVVLGFSLTTGVEDPASVKALTVSPNPTNGQALLNLELESAAEVRLELSNMLGQVVQSFNAGQVSNLNQTLDLSQLASGTYLLRLTIDQDIALRRVVLQR